MANYGSTSWERFSHSSLGSANWWDKMKKVFWTYALNTAAFNEDLL